MVELFSYILLSTFLNPAVNRALGSRRDDFILGVQVLAQGGQEAISIAHSTGNWRLRKKPQLQVIAFFIEWTLYTFAISGFDLIRSECFVFSHVADEGWMDANAGELLRFRRKIGADQVAVITDVKKKHR